MSSFLDLPDDVLDDILDLLAEGTMRGVHALLYTCHPWGTSIRRPMTTSAVVHQGDSQRVCATAREGDRQRGTTGARPVARLRTWCPGAPRQCGSDTHTVVPHCTPMHPVPTFGQQQQLGVPAHPVRGDAKGPDAGPPPVPHAVSTVVRPPSGVRSDPALLLPWRPSCCHVGCPRQPPGRRRLVLVLRPRGVSQALLLPRVDQLAQGNGTTDGAVLSVGDGDGPRHHQLRVLRLGWRGNRLQQPRSVWPLDLQSLHLDLRNNPGLRGAGAVVLLRGLHAGSLPGLHRLSLRLGPGIGATGRLGRSGP